MPEPSVCRVCGTTGNHPIHLVPEAMRRTGESFRYFLCSSCGCLQIAEVPQDLGVYYGSGYYSYATPTFGFAERIARRLRDGYCLTGRGLAGRILAERNPNEKLRILRLAGLERTSRVLDVGAGGGYLLGILHDHGFRNIEGIDPFLDRDVEFRPGAWIRRRPLEEIQGAFGLVMFHHSYEHMVDPVAPLREARRLLGPQGKVVVRIPVVDGEAWDLYKENWAAIDAPRHLFLHSHRSFAHAAASAGLKIVHEVQDSETFQFWASELALRGLPQIGASSGRAHFTRQELAAFAVRAAELNALGRGDQTGFILESA